MENCRGNEPDDWIGLADLIAFRFHGVWVWINKAPCIICIICINWIWTRRLTVNPWHVMIPGQGDGNARCGLGEIFFLLQQCSGSLKGVWDSECGEVNCGEGGLSF